MRVLCRDSLACPTYRQTITHIKDAGVPASLGSSQREHLLAIRHLLACYGRLLGVLRAVRSVRTAWTQETRLDGPWRVDRWVRLGPPSLGSGRRAHERGRAHILAREVVPGPACRHVCPTGPKAWGWVRLRECPSHCPVGAIGPG